MKDVVGKAEMTTLWERSEKFVVRKTLKEVRHCEKVVMRMSL